MSADKDISRLVDLLYDDELDEETAGELRASIEDSKQGRQELEANQEFLDELRRHTESAEVSEQTHASIVDHARQAAHDAHDTENTDNEDASPADAAKPRGRTPRSNGDDASSVWSRIDRSSVTQLVAAAVALMASGYLLYTMAQRGGGLDEAPSGAAPAQRADKLPESADETSGEAAGDRLAEAPAEKSQGKPEQQRAEQAAATTKSEVGPRENRKQENRQQDQQKQAAPTPKGREAQKEAEPAKPTTGTELAKAKKKAPSKDSVELKTRRLRERSADKDGKTSQKAILGEFDSDDDSGAAKVAEAPAYAQEEKKQAPSETAESEQALKAADNDDLADLMNARGRGGGGESPAPSGEGSGKTSAEDPENAGANVDSDTERADARAKTGSAEPEEPIQAIVDRVEQAYQKRSWSEVSRLSQQALTDAEGRQAARLRELRARALASLGKTDAALRQWKALQANHPDYKPDVVARQLRSLQDRNNPANSDEAAPASGSSPK